MRLVRRSIRTARFVYTTLILVLFFSAGFGQAQAVAPLSNLLIYAPSKAPALNTTAVTNNASVLSYSVSLGTNLEVQGVATTAQGPLANAPVSLHMGDITLAQTQTNQSGEYSFSVPVSLYYLPAAWSNGATVYTVVEPTGLSPVSTPSAVTRLAVDFTPLYVIIAVMTGIVLIALYLYTRRFSSTRTSLPFPARPAQRLNRSDSNNAPEIGAVKIEGPERSEAIPHHEELATRTEEPEI